MGAKPVSLNRLAAYSTTCWRCQDALVGNLDDFENRLCLFCYLEILLDPRRTRSQRLGWARLNLANTLRRWWRRAPRQILPF